MKFGDQLLASQKPEWAQEYVDYLCLKRLLGASQHLKRDHATVIDEKANRERAEFDEKWASRLSMELNKVNAFFTTQLQLLEELTGRLATHMQESQVNGGVRKQLGRKIGRYLQLQHSLVEYSSLNFMAFFKICKKHDKMMGGTMTQSITWVRQEPFFAPGRERLARVKVQLEGLSDGIPLETIQMSDNLATTAIRSKALYFFMGAICMGSFCILCLALLPHDSDFSHRHMGSMVDFWRFFVLMNALVWLCGICTYVFEKYGINHVFLLGINASTCLPADWYFTVAALHLFILILTMVLFMADFKFSDTCYQQAKFAFQRCDAYPMFVLVSSIMVPFLPSRHFRRKYRRNLLSCLISVVTAPFPLVTFAANILGDVLCSFTRPLKDLEFVSCYTLRLLSGRTFPKSSRECYQISNDLISPGRVILIIPFWFRLMQCLRRYLSSGDKWPHLANLVKYICSLSVGLISINHLIDFGFTESGANLTWGALAVVATVYSYLWDIYMDWGLELVSARRDLGDDHVDADGNRLQAEIYPRSFYRWATLLNLVGRSVWSTNLTIVLPFWNFGYYKPVVETILSLVELLRRGMWILLRVELEHLRTGKRFPSLCYVPPVATRGRQDRLSVDWGPSLLTPTSVRRNPDPSSHLPFLDLSNPEEPNPSSATLHGSTWHVDGGLVADKKRAWGRPSFGDEPKNGISMVPLDIASASSWPSPATQP